MSASPASIPSLPSDLKNEKKKRGKKEASQVSGTTSTANAAKIAAPSSPVGSTNGTASHEPAFLRELQKNLRNTSKKLNATTRVDAIISEYPNQTLDELVASKKINADQRAQILKKPALQETLAQIEEQISQYKQLCSYYQDINAKEKSELQKAHKEEVDLLKSKIAADAENNAETKYRERLLVLSRFLRCAAAMRGVADESSIEGRAFEGSLYQVYGGTEEAVNAMIKLIDGADEKVLSVESELLEYSYAKVKQASTEYVQPSTEPAWTEETKTELSAAINEPLQATDPTIANAGLTELQEPSVAQATTGTNGFSVHDQSFSGETAPIQAQSIWEESQATNPMSASTIADEWVKVQAPETSVQAPPALESSDSWTDTAPAPTAATNGSQQPQDGFAHVIRHTRQGSGRGRGGLRGRGGPRGDGHRGRGGFNRGDSRGRGRGRGGEYRGRGRGGFPSQGGTAGEPLAG
ncbi:hypothetical protein FQN57_001188 [Myotisia sp. PD_48]|nr:hypothetical protein FQN57_001188 [Myotisia sp. PD_48]